MFVLTRLLGHHVFLHLWRVRESALSPHPEIQYLTKIDSLHFKVKIVNIYSTAFRFRNMR